MKALKILFADDDLKYSMLLKDVLTYYYYLIVCEKHVNP